MRKKAGTIFIYIFLGVSFAAIAEGCFSSGKKCGCGSDLSRAYKYKKGRSRY